MQAGRFFSLLLRQERYLLEMFNPDPAKALAARNAHKVQSRPASNASPNKENATSTAHDAAENTAATTESTTENLKAEEHTLTPEEHKLLLLSLERLCREHANNP